MRTPVLALILAALAGCAPSGPTPYQCVVGEPFPVPVTRCDPGEHEPSLVRGYSSWLSCDPVGLDAWIIEPDGWCGLGYSQAARARDRAPCDGLTSGNTSCTIYCGWAPHPTDDECSAMRIACGWGRLCEYPIGIELAI